MPFTGKATFSAGETLPELVEDVSDLIGIVSPYETPLLDHLGDGKRSAMSTVHEWLEDALLPNTDTLDQDVFDPDATNATALTVANGSRFRIGDLLQPEGSAEVMLVTAVAGNSLTVVRGYGGTVKAALSDGQTLRILGNAALEGADAPAARFTARTRRQNYTQIFTSTVEISGSMQAARSHGVADELDYQKQERLRELLRELENCILNGAAPEATPQGSATVRRSMNGIVRQITTHILAPNAGGIPAGDGLGENTLNEAVLNAALRRIWESSSGRVDTIVVNGFQKRRVNSFASGLRAYGPADTAFRDQIGLYESDFGVCRVVLSRWMPADAVLLLDSSRIEVMPLSGRSFHYKPLAATGDRVSGQLVGEYTMEFRNENAHAIIRGLAAE